MLRFSVTDFKTSIGAALALGLAVASVPAQAQDDAEVRIRALEAQVRALQRVVFPGGDGRFFEPQVDRGTSSQGGSQAGTPATGAVTDLGAIETRLTASARRRKPSPIAEASAVSDPANRLAATASALSRTRSNWR